jgi:hypothetical protein
MTTTFRPRISGVSQLAQWLTPLPRSRLSPATPSSFNCAPVATTTAREVLFTRAGHQTPSPIVRKLDCFKRIRGELGAIRRSLLLSDAAKLVAGDSLDKAGEAVDLLDAQTLAARNTSGENKRLVAKPRARQSCGQTSDSGSGDYQFELARAHVPTR